jgi:hypothetical protein
MLQWMTRSHLDKWMDDPQGRTLEYFVASGNYLALGVRLNHSPLLPNLAYTLQYVSPDSNVDVVIDQDAKYPGPLRIHLLSPLDFTKIHGLGAPLNVELFNACPSLERVLIHGFQLSVPDDMPCYPNVTQLSVIVTKLSLAAWNKLPRLFPNVNHLTVECNLSVYDSPEMFLTLGGSWTTTVYTFRLRSISLKCSMDMLKGTRVREVTWPTESVHSSMVANQLQARGIRLTLEGSPTLNLIKQIHPYHIHYTGSYLPHHLACYAIQQKLSVEFDPKVLYPSRLLRNLARIRRRREVLYVLCATWNRWGVPRNLDMLKQISQAVYGW